MTFGGKVKEILASFWLILISILLFALGESAYQILILFYSVMMGLYGLRLLVYYFAMARYMVGGKAMLYRGILFFDFSTFAATLVRLPHVYILLYLAGTLAFSGIVDVLRALEARKIQGAWKLKISQGLICILTAGISIVFWHSPEMVVYNFAIGLVYSAIVRVINAFRSAPVIVVQ